MYYFYFEDESWCKKPVNISSRSYHSSCIYEDQLIIFGGYREDISTTVNEVISYDIKNECFSMVKCYGDIPHNRSHHRCVTKSNFMYIYGGLFFFFYEMTFLKKRLL